MKNIKKIYIKEACKTATQNIENAVYNYLKIVGEVTDRDMSELLKNSRLQQRKTDLKRSLEYLCNDAEPEKLPPESRFMFQEYTNH